MLQTVKFQGLQSCLKGGPSHTAFTTSKQWSLVTCLTQVYMIQTLAPGTLQCATSTYPLEDFP